MNISYRNIFRSILVIGLLFICEESMLSRGSYKAYLKVNRYLITSSGNQSTTTAGNVNLHYIDPVWTSDDPITGVNEITASCTSIGLRKIDIDMTAVPATGYHFHHWGLVKCTEGDGEIDYQRHTAFDQYKNPEYVRVQNAGANVQTKKYAIDVFFEEDFYAKMSVAKTTGTSGSPSVDKEYLGTTTSGQNVTFNLTAPSASSGYHFTGWTGSNITFGTSGNLQTTATVVTNTTSGKSNPKTYTATANYAENYYASLTIKTTSGTSGTPTISGTNNVDSPGGTVTFNITAPDPNPGYHFTGWSGSGITFVSSGSKSTQAKVAASTTAGSGHATTYEACANYAANYYVKVQTVSDPVAGGSSYVKYGTPFSGTSTSEMNGNGQGWSGYEETFSIKTFPASNYHFTGWEKSGGTITSASSVETTVKVKTTSGHTGTGNPAVYTFTAKYVENIYYAKLTATAGENGTVSVAEGTKSTKTAGGNVTFDITATPSSGYHLVEWTVTKGSGSFESSTSATTKFTAAASNSYDLENATTYTVHATFAKDEFGAKLSTSVNSISDSSSSTAQVSTDGSNWSSSHVVVKDNHDQDVTFHIKATPSSGYKFVGWSETDGSSTVVPGLGATGTYIVKSASIQGATNAKSLFAIFKKECTIVINANFSGTISDRIVFNVVNKTDASIKYRISVPIGGSRTLKDVAAGEYTITPENSWSWNYTTTPSSSDTNFNSQNISTNNFTITSKGSTKKHDEASSTIGY